MAVTTLSRPAELRQEAIMRAGLLISPADQFEFTSSDCLGGGGSNDVKSSPCVQFFPP